MKKAFCFFAAATVLARGLAVAGDLPTIPLGATVCSKYKEQDAVRGTQAVSIFGLACIMKMPAEQVCEQNAIAPTVAAGPRPQGGLFVGYLCYRVKCPNGVSTLATEDVYGVHAGSLKQPSQRRYSGFMQLMRLHCIRQMK